MKIDISRDTFEPAKRYSRVLMQQGRVQIDADWNEQVAIFCKDIRHVARDLGGRGWGPGDSFRISVGEKTQQGFPLFVAPGRYYADGLLCENGDPDQDPFTSPPTKPQGTLSDKTIAWMGDQVTLGPDNQGFILWLKARERLVTALDDDDIREVALGGPDTAARTTVDWWVEAAVADKKIDTATAIYYKAAYQAIRRLLPEAPVLDSGCLMAKAGGPTASKPADPCVIHPESRYRGLENQLYRVEISKSGGIGEAEFVWSRDNGSVAAKWAASPMADQIQFSGIGLAGLSGFVRGQWVELTDDDLDDENEAKVFQIEDVSDNLLTLDTSEENLPQLQTDKHPKVRRWDSPGEILVDVDPKQNDGWIELEDGLFVKFEDKKTYQRGDCWLIPARTDLGDGIGGIVWDDPQCKPPRRMREHQVPLAFVKPNGNDPPTIIDLRISMPRATRFRLPKVPAAPVGLPTQDKLLLRLIAVGTQTYKSIQNITDWRTHQLTLDFFDDSGARVTRHKIVTANYDANDKTKDMLSWDTDDGGPPTSKARGAQELDPFVNPAVILPKYNPPDLTLAGLCPGAKVIYRLNLVSDPEPVPQGNPNADPGTVRFVAMYYFFSA